MSTKRIYEQVASDKPQPGVIESYVKIVISSAASLIELKSSD